MLKCCPNHRRVISGAEHNMHSDQPKMNFFPTIGRPMRCIRPIKSRNCRPRGNKPLFVAVVDLDPRRLKFDRQGFFVQQLCMMTFGEITYFSDIICLANRTCRRKSQSSPHFLK